VAEPVSLLFIGGPGTGPFRLALHEHKPLLGDIMQPVGDSAQIGQLIAEGKANNKETAYNIGIGVKMVEKTP
jgi:hypothetical protein